MRTGPAASPFSSARRLLAFCTSIAFALHPQGRRHESVLPARCTVRRRRLGPRMRPNLQALTRRPTRSGPSCSVRSPRSGSCNGSWRPQRMWPSSGPATGSRYSSWRPPTARMASGAPWTARSSSMGPCSKGGKSCGRRRPWRASTRRRRRRVRAACISASRSGAPRSTR